MQPRHRHRHRRQPRHVPDPGTDPFAHTGPKPVSDAVTNTVVHPVAHAHCGPDPDPDSVAYSVTDPVARSSSD